MMVRIEEVCRNWPDRLGSCNVRYRDGGMVAASGTAAGEPGDGPRGAGKIFMHVSSGLALSCRECQSF